MAIFPWIIIILLTMIIYYLAIRYERKIAFLSKMIEQNTKHIEENKELIEKNRALIEKNKHNIERNAQSITKIDIDLED